MQRLWRLPGWIRWPRWFLIALLLFVAYCSSKENSGCMRRNFGTLSWLPVAFFGRQFKGIRCKLVFHRHGNSTGHPSQLRFTLGVPRLFRRLDSAENQRLMLLISVLAMTSIVQFPFSAPIYFCYAAPTLILAASALFALTPAPPRLALGVLGVFYLLFVGWRVTPAFVFRMGYSATPYSQAATLTLPRGGNVTMEPIQADMYQELIPLIQAHSSSEFTYAGPDCAEIYFLTGLKNPTRTLFDSFDDPNGRTDRILQAIDAHRITVLTFNDQPGFAGTINRQLEEAVKTSFPYSKQLGHFQVRWRQ